MVVQETKMDIKKLITQEDAIFHTVSFEALQLKTKGLSQENA